VSRPMRYLPPTHRQSKDDWMFVFTNLLSSFACVLLLKKKKKKIENRREKSVCVYGGESFYFRRGRQQLYFLC
jgi:hypothetical protein